MRKLLLLSVLALSACAQNQIQATNSAVLLSLPCAAELAQAGQKVAAAGGTNVTKAVNADTAAQTALTGTACSVAETAVLSALATKAVVAPVTP